MSSFKSDRELGDSTGDALRSATRSCRDEHALTQLRPRSGLPFASYGRSEERPSKRLLGGWGGWTRSTWARSSGVGTRRRSRPPSGSLRRSTSASPGFYATSSRHSSRRDGAPRSHWELRRVGFNEPGL